MHTGTSLNIFVGEGKRFMAYNIVNGLKKSGKVDLLRVLQQGVATNEKQKGKKHQVFHLSFDARKCFNEKMIEQKLTTFITIQSVENGIWLKTFRNICIPVRHFMNLEL